MRFVILLTSGDEVITPEGCRIVVDSHGLLQIVRNELIKDNKGYAQYDWVQTYSPHAWVSYKEWKEQWKQAENSMHW